MGSFVLLYDNLSDRAILSGSGAWLSALPLTNMQDADIEKVARSSNAQNASTKFTINLGSQESVGGIALGPCNLSPGATWRWRIYSDSGFTVPFYDSGVLTVPGSIIDWTDSNAWLEWEDPNFWYGLAEGIDELPQYLYHIPATTKACQYSLVEIFDEGNFDGAVQIGRLMLGRIFRPSINYGEDNALSIIPLTDVEDTLGGKRVFWDRNQRRAFRCNFPRLDESEVLGNAFDVMLKMGLSKQVFVVPDPDDDLTGSRRSFLCNMKQLSPMQQLLVDRGSVGFEVEEVL